MSKPKKEKKEKREIPLRTRGEVIQPLNRPSKVLFDLAQAEEKAATLAPPTATHHPLPPPTTIQENKTYPVSPKRDFTKFANSIVRDAIPSGLFKGTSKNTYDALYQRTRGAIEPVRKIKAVQSDVLRWANVSHNTLRAHLKHLELIGLLKIHYRLGDNSGAEYEVLLPEEINTNSYHPPPPPTTTIQDLGSPSSQNLLVGGGRFVPENIEPNRVSKTFLKTLNQIDDEKPILTGLEMLNEATLAATGSELTQREIDAFPELLKVIIEEISLARLKTNSVTNYLKFTATHLRRQLNLARQKPIAQMKPFEPGAQQKDTGEVEQTEQIEPMTLEPLGSAERSNLLVIYRPVFKEKGIEALENVRGIVTQEDWNWLVENLREN